MLKIGKTNRLKVVKEESHGFYLDGGDDWGTILLPSKSAPAGLKIADEIDVFVYFDSEDTIIATTTTPLAQVGEFCSLKVKSIENIGVFLDWGLAKDLFVPLREQIFKMEVGQSYVVYLYIDSSERIAATTRISNKLSKTPPPYSVGEQVDLLLYQVTDLGIKAVVNRKYDGLIYKDDLINHLKPGQKTKGYILKVRPDGKIDLTLKPRESRSEDPLTEQILNKIKEAGGTLEVTSKSPAAVINSMFNVSRKKFKIALGSLYKEKKIVVDEDSISITVEKA